MDRQTDGWIDESRPQKCMCAVAFRRLIAAVLHLLHSAADATASPRYR